MAEMDNFYKYVAKYHECENYDSNMDLTISSKNLIEVLINYFVNNVRLLIPGHDNLENSIKNIEKGAKYLKENFVLNDVNVFKEKEDFDEFEQRIKKISGKLFRNARKYIIYKNTVSQVSPFNVKIQLYPGNKYEGYTSFSYPYDPYNDSIFIEPYIEHIYINSGNSNTADISYIHEIAHTQMEMKKGSYHILFNMETISMLLELIYAYDDCDEKKLLGTQVEAVGDLINFSEYIKDNSITNKIYFYSNLCSLELFAIYKMSDINEKLKMKDYIQQIFNGNMSVEDLLKYYDVVFNRPQTDIIIRSLNKK